MGRDEDSNNSINDLAGEGQAERDEWQHGHRHRLLDDPQLGVVGALLGEPRGWCAEWSDLEFTDTVYKYLHT